MIFSGLLGLGAQRVVLKFGARAMFGSPAGGASLFFFWTPAAADDTARALRSDCSLPFLSGFSLKRGSHRRIKARFTPM